MREPQPTRSGVRDTTRRAILGAAASVLARDRAATLAEIAEAAGVGRSTLHRHFADREELVAAAVEDSLAALGQAVEGAFDPEVSPGWVEHVLWALVYTAAEEADTGRLPRHGVPATVIRTLENGIRGRGGGARTPLGTGARGPAAGSLVSQPARGGGRVRARTRAPGAAWFPAGVQ